MSAIRVAGLRVSYPSPLLDDTRVHALCGVDLEVARGEFVALMGPVGAGKSTLCLALNGAIPHAVDCESSGAVVVMGQETRATTLAQLALDVGFVFEDAEAQLFNATVADEIAFGLEAMGVSPGEIERRIDAVLSQVALPGFRDRSPLALSGGEQKRLALASVLAMRPSILVLDEPTAGLDARGRFEVLSAIGRLQEEHGHEMTVLMATQDAEAVARFADRIFVLRDGQISLSGTPEEVFAQVGALESWGLAVPQLARLAYHLGLPPAYTPESAAQRWAGSIEPLPSPAPSAEPAVERPQAKIVEIRELRYEYPASDQRALHGVTLDIARGEWLGIVGTNGSGKTTLLKHLNGLLHPTSGTVCVDGEDTREQQVGQLARIVSYLPQNPDHSIFCATVREEIAYGPRQLGLRGQALDERVAESLDLLGLAPLAEHPPAVLGYGQRRQVALASVLAMNAPMLVLDEPSVGLDRGTVMRLMDVVSARHRQGTTVVIVTHDLQLVARYAQRVIILSEGRVCAEGRPHDVLADVSLVRESGLEPLPVTLLGYALGWPRPLPVRVAAWEAA
jgi:energy-coupling factor transporter ATP-binding protein EcfA2